MQSRQKEVLYSKEVLEVVNEKAEGLKDPRESWAPTEFLPDFSSDTWQEEVLEIQAKAKELDDAFFMALTGNMVTEEGLPNFLTWINQNEFIADKTGCDDHPWAKWARGWTAEENKHGDMLHKYLYISGRVDMRAVEESVGDFIRHGFDSETANCPYGGAVFTSFQERATRISHSRISKDALAGGADKLAKMCQIIAADEGRHEAVYQAFVDKIFQVDPDGMMVAFMNTMKSGIVMPFKATGKDSYTFFSEVTEAIGMYTYQDYIDILEFLIKKWKIADMTGLSSEATAAQEYLCKLPDRYRRIALRKTPKTLKDIDRPFLWVKPRVSEKVSIALSPAL